MNDVYYYLLTTLTRIRSNKKFPDPPPLPLVPLLPNKKRLFLGSSSVVSAKASSPSAFDTSTLSALLDANTSFSKTKHHTARYTFFKFGSVELPKYK